SRSALRFFPLYPLLGRALGYVLGGMFDVAFLVLANVPALLFAVLLVRLVRREGGDQAAAGRAAWFVALVPPGFVLVFAYAEAIRASGSTSSRGRACGMASGPRPSRSGARPAPPSLVTSAATASTSRCSSSPLSSWWWCAGDGRCRTGPTRP